MSNLIRKQEPRGQVAQWDPFRMMREVMGRDFPDFGSLLGWNPFREFESTGASRVFNPDIEVKEAKDHYEISVDVPGMKEEDVQISLSGNRLTLSGQREQERREEGEQLYLVERSYGSFTRSFTLPQGVDAENVKADLRDGVLRIAIPKRDVETARQIPIGGGARARAPELRVEGGQDPAASTDAPVESRVGDKGRSKAA
jgi:HSP20 family protein